MKKSKNFKIHRISVTFLTLIFTFSQVMAFDMPITGKKNSCLAYAAEQDKEVKKDSDNEKNAIDKNENVKQEFDNTIERTDKQEDAKKDEEVSKIDEDNKDEKENIKENKEIDESKDVEEKKDIEENKNVDQSNQLEEEEDIKEKEENDMSQKNDVTKGTNQNQNIQEIQENEEVEVIENVNKEDIMNSDKYNYKNPYVQNFDDGDISNWKAAIGSPSELSCENGQIQVARGQENNLILVDQNSPEILDGEYEFKFTLKNSPTRVGVVFRYTSKNSYAFAGYNIDGTWIIETAKDWKDGIPGPILSLDKEYTMKVRYVGNEVTMYLDGKQVFKEDVSSMDEFPTKAGKIGIRTWYDGKTLLVDDIKYSTPAPEVPVVKPEKKKITNTDVISSDSMKVTIDKDFPNVVQYEKDSKVMYGNDESFDVFKINGNQYKPSVEYNKIENSAEYTLNFNDIDVVMKAKIEVKDNILNMDITEIQENGDTKINTIEIPKHNLLSVRSNEEKAEFAGSRMCTSVYKSGDTFIDLTKDTNKDSVPKNYRYAILSNSKLSGAVWSNAFSDYSQDNDNERIVKQTVDKGEYYNTGIWSTAWTYRAEGMEDTENLPSLKVVITDDTNKDGNVDWQDGAIAFRDIMNNPFGSEDVPNLVVMRIPMNFASQATNPFLKILDETKRMYLATDGLGQWIELKGYQEEGHDSAHPDYGGNIGIRQGGAVDMNTLIDEGHKYNGYFGAHISASGAMPEAKAFSDTLINPQKPGWDWLDPAYCFDKPTERKEATAGARLNRFKELKKDVPNLDFIYNDAYFEQGFNARRISQEVNSLGWAMTTEFPYILEYDSTWNHWAVDYSYGGKNMKGYNSKIARFIRNHQKDTWIARHPLLGGTEMCDFEGWQGRVNFNDMIRMTFETNLPTKYMQHFKIMKWTDNTINFENNVSVSNTTGRRVITKDGHAVLEGNAYLLPWSPKTEDKLYHWNNEGGSTTWTLPLSWGKLDTVKLYRLTDQGKQFVKDINVTDNQVSIDSEASTPYVVCKGESDKNIDVNFGEGTHIKDPGFNGQLLDSWKVTGDGASVKRNNRGQYELNVEESNGTIVSQQLEGLSEGTYSASVYVQIDGNRKASIGVKDYGGDEVTNYTDSSIAYNYISADSKNRTKMQRMRVLFDVPKDQTTATLYLKVDKGEDNVTFDDVRIVKTKRTPNPTNAYFVEDFENVVQGVYPFVKGVSGGVNDPRTHLSELHAPYTQKGWNGKLVDDVLNGKWSLKAHKEASGLLLQTIPQTLRFIPGNCYKVTLKYESEVDNAYGFIVGDGQKVISSKNFKAAHEPTVFTKSFEASVSGQSWIGIQATSKASDLIIDDIIIEEIDYLPDEEENNDFTPVDLSTVPQSTMKATATSEEIANGDVASNAIDGNIDTMWHTKWDLTNPLPQSLILNLGGNYAIDKIEVLPRQSQDNGKITKYELYASTEGSKYTKIASGNWDTTSQAKTIKFDKVEASYIKLTALEGVGGFASIAEINVFRQPVTIQDAESVEVSTLERRRPKLPKEVNATLSDGKKVNLPVKWNSIDRELYSKPGNFEVEGSVNGTEVKVKAVVTVNASKTSVTKIETVNVTTTAGKAPVLPSKVIVIYSDKTYNEMDVVWDEIEPSKYAKEGKFTVEGKIEGINIKVVANVTVTEKSNSDSITSNADITKDGKVDIGDLGVAAYLFGLDNNSDDWDKIKKADMNGNGKVDIYDLVFIAKKILEIK